MITIEICLRLRDDEASNAEPSLLRKRTIGNRRVGNRIRRQHGEACYNSHGSNRKKMTAVTTHNNRLLFHYDNALRREITTIGDKIATRAVTRFIAREEQGQIRDFLIGAITL